MTNLPDDQSLYSFNKVFVSIMDENLNLISQGYLKKENTYNFNFSFDYKGGLWIAYQEDLQDDESLIKGDLIQFPKIFGERTSGSN
jgi:preprotein translocase subunit SecD